MVDEMKSIVDNAIEESVNAFVRGVYSANPTNPDVTISDDVVKWLQNDTNMFASFKEQLGSDPHKWRKDGPPVCRAAFHAGSLAALHAYSKNNPRVVNRCDVKAALEHISGICKVGVDIVRRTSEGERWIYCRYLPTP